MEGRLRARGVRVAALPAVLLFTVVSHAVLATVFVPVHSDLNVYERYAASVARGIQDGTSLSVARDEIIRDDARRNDLPEPTSDAFLIEYPPLAVIWMATAGIGLEFDAGLGPRTDLYGGRYRLAMFALDLLLIFILVKWAAPGLVTLAGGVRQRAWRLAVYGVASLILGNLLFDRLDLVVGTLLLPSVMLLVRGSWRASFLLLALAINFKASPLALAPLWVVASLPSYLFAQARTRTGALVKAMAVRALTLAGMAIFVFLPFLIIEGSRASDFLRFRAVQGVQIESVPASILLVLHAFGLPLQVSFTLGTFELQTPLSPVMAAASPLLLLVAVAIAAALYARTATTRCGRLARTDRRVPTAPTAPTVPTVPAGSLATSDPPLFVTATVATLLLTLVTSKLLSPQYLIWLLPLVPLLDIGAARTRAFQLWFLFTCTVTTAIFPYLLGRTLARHDPASGGYLDPTPLGVGLVLLRNALLIWLAWLALRPLLHPTSEDGTTRPD